MEFLPWMRPAARSALQIGLGGGLVSRMFEAYEIPCTTYELDPGLVCFAREHLGVEGDVRVGDGRALLLRDPRAWDLMVLDAFAGETIPVHLLTREAFALARERLGTRGVLCAHLIDRRSGPLVASVARTLDAVFANGLAIRRDPSDALPEVFLFASDGPLPLPLETVPGLVGTARARVFVPDVRRAVVLTDDRNPAPRLGADAARALRALQRDRQRPSKEVASARSTPVHARSK